MPDQYLRRASLFVIGVSEFAGPSAALGDQTTQANRPGELSFTVKPAGGTPRRGLDMSALRFTFKVFAIDEETPPYAIIMVYNLSAERCKALLDKTYTQIILQAGYVGGDFEQIFSGSIKQVFVGRESPTDTYVKIVATDSDLLYNFGIVNITVGAGIAAKQRIQTIVDQMAKAAPDQAGFTSVVFPDVPLGPPLPRGKVMFGMGRSLLRDAMNTAGLSWSIQNGQVTIVPVNGYLSGEAVVLNSKTGMIGMPQQTDEGIRVRCLINPKLRVGGLIKLNNADIIPATIDVRFSAINMLARIHSGADGLYRVYVIEYTGDTRGQEWYADLICMAANATASDQPNQGVSN